MKWMMLLLVYYFTFVAIHYMTSSAPEHFRRSRFWGVTNINGDTQNSIIAENYKKGHQKDAICYKMKFYHDRLHCL